MPVQVRLKGTDTVAEIQTADSVEEVLQSEYPTLRVVSKGLDFFVLMCAFIELQHQNIYSNDILEGYFRASAKGMDFDDGEDFHNVEAVVRELIESDDFQNKYKLYAQFAVTELLGTFAAGAASAYEEETVCFQSPQPITHVFSA